MVILERMWPTAVGMSSLRQGSDGTRMLSSSGASSSAGCGFSHINDAWKLGLLSLLVLGSLAPYIYGPNALAYDTRPLINLGGVNHGDGRLGWCFSPVIYLSTCVIIIETSVRREVR